MHADVVGAASDQAAAKQGQTEREEFLLDLVKSARFSRARRQLSRRPESLHLLAVAGVATDREGDLAFSNSRNSRDERQVFFLHRALLDLARKRSMREIRLGDDEHARGGTVEAMDDARPQLAPDALEIADVAEQGVDEGSRPVSRGGVHEEARRPVGR